MKLGGCGGIVGMIAISMLYIVCFLGAKLTTAVIVNVYKTINMHAFCMLNTASSLRMTSLSWRKPGFKNGNLH